MQMGIRLRGIALLGVVALFLGLLPPLLLHAGSVPSGPNAQITDTGLGKYGDAELPRIVAVGDTLYATWKDDRANQNNAVYFSKSTDKGATWSANVLVSNLGASDTDDWIDDPGIAVQPDGKTIYIIWYRFYREDSNRTNDVRISFSTDGGQSFRFGTLINGTPADPNADVANDLSGPKIAVDASTGKVYVLIHTRSGGNAGDGYDIAIRSYNPDLSGPVRTVLNDQPRSGRDVDTLVYGGPQMSLAASNGVVCAAWEDTRGRFSIYGTCSGDGGKTYGANVAVSGQDAAVPHLALAPDGGLYATYTDSADTKTITLRRSADKGATWGAPRLVVALDTAEKIFGSDLAIDANGQVVLPWSGGFSGIGGSTSANLYTSVDGGQNFANTTLNDKQGQYPDVAKQDGITVAVGGAGTATQAFVAWSDTRNVQDQIWFARADLDGVPPTAPGNLRATGDDASILLIWGASADASGVQGYRVYRATASGGPYAPLAPVLVTSTSYRDVSLDATPYFYKVAAVDGTGNTGPLSNEASVAAQVRTDILVNGTLAYEVGNDLRARAFSALGSERTLGQGNQPRFSRDGARVFFYDSAGIQSRPLAGGAPQLFFQNAKVVDYALASDEQHFGSLILRQGVGPPSFPVCTVTEPHYGTASGFTYTDDNDLATGVGVSADGRWLVFTYLGFCNAAAFGNVSPSSFCIVNTANSQKNCLKGAGYEDAQFAPSGNWLAFVATISGQKEIWKAQLRDDGTLANYTQLTRGLANQPAGHPAWSSDGNYIVFQRGASADANAPQTLYTVRSDGGALRNLQISGTYPAWFGGGPAPVGAQSYRAYLPLVRK